MKTKMSNTLINHSRCRMIVSAVVLFTLVVIGCEDALEVNNPNSVLEDDLTNPAAATAIANGALATVSRGAGEILAIYTCVTDEGTWIGSRDAWNQLRLGNVGDANNEFTDDAWQWVTEGRWMADKAVSELTAFDDAGDLEDRADLARSHLYAALIRVQIADVFDDFVFSDKQEAAPPVGETNMSGLYDNAITSLNTALTIAQSVEDTELQTRIIALRARAAHAKAIWGKVNPRGTANTADPYVNAGRADAETVLGMVADGWRWQLKYSASSVDNDYSWQVNGRLELDVVDAVTDPIDGIQDPRVTSIVTEFKDDAANGGTDYAPFTMVSAREMHLIVAESDIVEGNMAAVTERLNDLRALDGLSAITTEDVGEILQYERRANLFLQMRRLADMYRFDDESPEWLGSSEAKNSPGSFFPIVRREIEANPNIKGGAR